MSIGLLLVWIGRRLGRRRKARRLVVHVRQLRLLHVQAWKLREVVQIELVQELLSRAVEKRTPGGVLAANFSHQPPLDELLEAVVTLDATHRIDLGHRHRLPVRDDGENLHQTPRQPLFAGFEEPGNDIGKARLSAKLVATRNADELQRTAVLERRAKLLEALSRITFADLQRLRERGQRHRCVRNEQHRFQASDEIQTWALAK